MAHSLDRALHAAGGMLAAGARPLTREFLCVGTAVLLGLFFSGIAIVAAAMGWYAYLTLTMPDYQAMLIVAGVALTFCIVCGLVVRSCLSGKDSNPPKSDAAAISEVTAIIEREVTTLVAENPKSAAVVSMVAGLALGISPELRTVIFKQLSK